MSERTRLPRNERGMALRKLGPTVPPARECDLLTQPSRLALAALLESSAAAIPLPSLRS